MKKIITVFITMCFCLAFALNVFAESEITMPELEDPSINVTQTSIPKLVAGHDGVIEFTLENTSFSYAAEITLTVYSESGDIKIDPANSILTVEPLSFYGKTNVRVPVTVSPAANGQYTLNISGSTKSTKDFFTQQTISFSGSVTFVVERGDIIMQPVIKDMRFGNSEYYAGDSPVLTFTIENPNAFPILGVTATLSGFVDGAVDPADPDQTFFIDELGAKKTRSFTVKMKTSAGIAAQIYNFGLELSASDEFGNSYSSSKSAYFTVIEVAEQTPDEFTAQSPRIIVDSYKMTPTKAQPGDKVTLKINLLNLGVLDAENVKVSLGGYETEYITLREITPEKNIGKISCQETVSVEYSMTLSSVFPQGQNVPLTVFLSYGDLQGKNYVDQGYVNIISPIPEEKPQKEDPVYVPPVYKVPKVIIESFETDTDLIQAGSEFGLSFTLRNTSEDLKVENLRITLMDSGSSSSIFTPVNSGYSFFMDEIDKLGEHTLSIPLFAKVSTESGIYTLNFQIEYEYYVKDGEKTGHYDSNSLTETISLKVVQPINIEVSNFYCDYSGFIGGQNYIMFTYTNKSRSNLYFMNIDIEGDAHIPEGKVEIGSIPSGYSDSADFMISLDGEPGEKELYVVFNFKDSLNQESSIRYPFTMYAEEQSYIDPGYEIIEPGIDEPIYIDEPEDNQNLFEQYPWLIYAVIAAAAVVVIVVIVIIVVAVRRKKAREEEEEDESI